MAQPNLAILYWFYKEPVVTQNHLKLLRQHNPNYKIYGLYGGDPAEADVYKSALESELDDFWVYPGTYGADPYTKWIHGDLLLLDWYDKRGRNFEWDSIVITQWDMLVFDDVLSQMPGLKTGQIYFAGYRDLDEALEKHWKWTSPSDEHRQEYTKFCEYMAKAYNWRGPLKACLYLHEVLPRQFFDRYLQMPDKHIGMLEYKDPTLATAWGFDIYVRDLGVYWGDWRTWDESPLIATGKHRVPDDFVKQELNKPDGWRIFHPNHSLW